MQSDLNEIYPPGAPMTYWRLNAERTALRARLKYLDGIKANCRFCAHWQAGRCDVFDDVPPAEFQQSDGKCESWVHDGVPF